MIQTDPPVRKRSPKMASATGMPAQPPSLPPEDTTERTPLLIGYLGPIKQPQSHNLLANFVSGWGLLTLLSSIALTVVILYYTLRLPFITFHLHPILNSLSILFLTLAILVLQPTHTASQKAAGQKAHAAFMLLSFLTMLAAVIGIEYNKFSHGGDHFKSPHAYLGVISAAWFLFQYVGGLTMLKVPKLYGGEAKAKAVWKYHRRGGYVLYLVLMSTVVASSKTEYVAGNMFSIVAPLVCCVLMFVGLLLRIRWEKLGFAASRNNRP